MPRLCRPSKRVRCVCCLTGRMAWYARLNWATKKSCAASTFQCATAIGTRSNRFYPHFRFNNTTYRQAAVTKLLAARLHLQPIARATMCNLFGRAAYSGHTMALCVIGCRAERLRLSNAIVSAFVCCIRFVSVLASRVRSCTVTSALSKIGHFPDLISPHQPFKQIQQVQHRINNKFEAIVHFAGDEFEMEDQRNWTDASFKTYCTPLDLPFPVNVPAGTEIAQSITLTVHPAPAVTRRQRSAEFGHDAVHALPPVEFARRGYPPSAW